MNNSIDTREKIKRLLCEITLQNSISDEVRLLSDGVLESIELLTLITEIEENFDVLIPPERISKENFDTINDITEMIDSLLAMKE